MSDPPCWVIADEFMAGEEETGDDGAGGESDGAFDYSTLAEAMDVSGSDADTDKEEDTGIDGLGGGPGGETPSGSGAHCTSRVNADNFPACSQCPQARWLATFAEKQLNSRTLAYSSCHFL